MDDISLEKKQFADRLKASRLAVGISADEAAAKVGKTKKSIYHWESGHAAPDVFNLKILARLYDTDCDTLLFGETNWPFSRISFEKFRKLDRDDQIAIQTALILDASRLKIDITSEHSKELAA